MDVEEASSKAVVLKIFGEELGEKLALAAGHGKRKDYRGVLEPTGAVTQCERAGYPFEPNMPCYIGGLPIPAKELLSGPDDELYVECEHILPVTEARWFLDLYMTTRKPDDEWTKQAIQLEYAQAHRVCNQAKSNFSFIKEDPTTGNPVISKVGIAKILKGIQIRARKHVNDYPQSKELENLMKAIADNVTTRSADIEAVVQQIIDYVNASSVAGDPNMAVLVRTSMLADPQALPPSLQEIYNAWYENSAEVRDYKNALFNAFVEETYGAYPQLRPENIRDLLFGNEIMMGVPSDYQTHAITSDFIQPVLRKFFERYNGTDKRGKTLLSTVYAAVYRYILEEMMRVGVTDDQVELFCVVYNAANIIALNEPNVNTILGPNIDIGEALQTRCEIRQKNVERERRSMERLLTDEDLNQEKVTPEEDAVYYLDGVQDELTRLFGAEWGVPAYGEIAAQFVNTYPEGVDRAKEAAALTGESMVLLALLPQDQDTAIQYADYIYEFILRNKDEYEPSDVRRAGGSRLRGRRPLYTNDQVSHLPRSNTDDDSRLRKRARTRRARRVRQSALEPKTR